MPTPRTSKKKTSKKTTSKKTAAGRSRQLVDDVLVKVTPQVQKRMDQLIETLQDTKQARIGDLKWLGGQILLRSRDVSEQLKNLREQSLKAAAQTTSAAVGVGKKAASAVGVRTSSKKKKK